jgi:hypothetical protein
MYDMPFDLDDVVAVTKITRLAVLERMNQLFCLLLLYQREISQFVHCFQEPLKSALTDLLVSILSIKHLVILCGVSANVSSRGIDYRRKGESVALSPMASMVQITCKTATNSFNEEFQNNVTLKFKINFS